MLCFFFNDTATPEIYTLSLHDALPIYRRVQHDDGDQAPLDEAEALRPGAPARGLRRDVDADLGLRVWHSVCPIASASTRSEEHTSELQSRQYLVCRLLLENNNLFT